MRHNVKLLKPVAGIDWESFRREGDPYLQRLGVDDETAIWLLAKLFLRDFEGYRRGKKWNAKRLRWESERCAQRSYSSCLGVSMNQQWRGKLAASYAASREAEVAWTPMREGELLRLREDGKSYRQIAKIMNKTKGSIQARVRYLSLGRRLA